MGAITLDEFFRRLKQGPPDPVYYFHGDEDVLKDEAVAALQACTGDLWLAAAGDDLTRLVQELDKLRAVAGARPATRGDVAAQVGAHHGVTVHDLADAVLARNGLKAAALVEPVLELAGMSGVRILSALGTHLVGLALAREELERGTTARQLPAVLLRHLMAARPYGLGDWKETAAKWATAAGHWSTADVSRAVRAALAADRALKDTSVTDERGIVSQLVLGFAGPARA